VQSNGFITEDIGGRISICDTTLLQRSRHLRRRPGDMSKSLNRTGSFIVRPMKVVFRIGGGGAASEGEDTEVSDGGAEVKDGDAF